MEIGDKVICIDDSIKSGLNMEEFNRDFPNWIKKDEIYTIREILFNDGLVTSVLLQELKNPIRFFTVINRPQECSFNIDRFRKLEEIEKSVEIEEELTIPIYVDKYPVI